MNAEDQLSEMRGTTQVTTRSQVKNKILSLTMLAIASMCAVFGYKQQLEAKAQRDEVIRLHREIKRLTQESEAARKEATMLRILMKDEKRKADAAILEAQKKK